jgi:hypothetical protein
MGSTPTGAAKIGELLIACGAIDQTGLESAITMAGRTGLPLGRTLVALKLITQAELDAGLRLQSIMRSASISMEAATTAFKTFKSQGVSFEQALASAGITSEITSYSKTGVLLLDSGLVTKAQLEHATKMSYETGTPIGRMLCLMGLLTPHLLSEVLAVQRRLRDQKITREEAVKQLARARSSKKRARGDAAKELAADKAEQVVLRRLKLGELLLMSGCISELDVMDALEVSLGQEKPIGEVLVDSGVLPASTLHKAIELQNSVNAGQISVTVAAQTLAYIAQSDERAKLNEDTSLQELSNTIKLGELLTKSEVISEQDISYAMDLVALFPSLIGKMLVVAGVIDEGILLAALRCQYLIREQHMSVDDAVQVLKYATVKRVTVDDALEDLGFDLKLIKNAAP